jgi:hypothetical protein
MVQLVELRQQFSRLLQRDADLPRLAVDLLYLLVHCIEAGPGEVRLGVWQPLWIVSPRCLAHGEEPFALQVFDQHTALPVRAVLHKVFGEDLCEGNVFNDQALPLG